MMEGVDQDGDGEVDYHEFIEMMTDKPKSTKKWNKKEKQTKIPETSTFDAGSGQRSWETSPFQI